MECHDIRALLSFAQRACEEVDPAEREALRQHLERCPDCAAFATADRQADELLARMMQDVPVPADLKQNVLNRLAAEGPRQSWKQLAAAAAILLALGGAVTWYFAARPSVAIADLYQVMHAGELDVAAVEQAYSARGIHVRLPRNLDYQYLQHADVIEFRGRRVAKLVFSRQDRPAFATVLVLPRSQFRLDEHDFAEKDLLDTMTMRIRHSSAKEDDPREFVYVIYYRGEISALELPFSA